MFLFLLLVLFGNFVGTIPMAALVAVMTMVAIGAFDGHSERPSTLKSMSKSETFVMIATVFLGTRPSPSGASPERLGPARFRLSYSSSVPQHFCRSRLAADEA